MLKEYNDNRWPLLIRDTTFNNFSKTEIISQPQIYHTFSYFKIAMLRQWWLYNLFWKSA